MSATAPILAYTRGMTILRAHSILAQPLVFGEPIQIEALEFIKLHEIAEECLALWSDSDFLEAEDVAEYRRLRRNFDSLSREELLNLIDWLQEEDDDEGAAS